MLKTTENRILLKLDEPETMSHGFIIPDNVAEQSQTGEAIIVGPGKINNSGILIPMSVSVGDKIMIQKGSGIEIKVDGVDYIMVKEEDVLIIL